MKVDWSLYECPYKKSSLIIPEQLQYIFSTNDSEDIVEGFLYNELAPNIKHQYKIYEVVDPVMNAIGDFLTEHPRARLKLLYLDFLEYIFSDHIRDSTKILVTPIAYSLASTPVSKCSKKELESFTKCKELYFTHYSEGFPIERKGSKYFYDCIFDTSKNTSEKMIGLLDNKQLKGGAINEILIGIGYLNYKLNMEDKLQFNPNKYGVNEYVDVALAMNMLPFDEDSLLSLVQSNLSINLSWGNGYIAVVSAVALLIGNLRNGFQKQMAIISSLLSAYKKLKDSCRAEDEIDFPVYNYLLEDIASIVYRQFLGKEKVITTKELNPVQKNFFEKVSQECRTHTYSMLYAGLAPVGVALDQVDKIFDIYSCYE